VEIASNSNEGQVNILIACAGETRPERFDEVDPKYFKRLMEINYLGVVNSILPVIPIMKKQKQGRIVVVGSILSICGAPGYSPYTPTKYALRGLIDGLDYEFKPWNIAFQLAIPADVDTPMYLEENKMKPEETKLISDPPVTPETVAKDIVKGLDNYRYFISTGMNGWLLSCSSAGTSPSSFKEILQQIFLGPIVRLIALGVSWNTYRVVYSVRKKEKAL